MNWSGWLGYVQCLICNGGCSHVISCTVGFRWEQPIRLFERNQALQEDAEQTVPLLCFLSLLYYPTRYFLKEDRAATWTRKKIDSWGMGYLYPLFGISTAASLHEKAAKLSHPYANGLLNTAFGRTSCAGGQRPDSSQSNKRYMGTESTLLQTMCGTGGGLWPCSDRGCRLIPSSASLLPIPTVV